ALGSLARSLPISNYHSDAGWYGFAQCRDVRRGHPLCLGLTYREMPPIVERYREKEGSLRNILTALKSVRLALALITYFVMTGILASLVPQGRDVSFYYSSLPVPLAALIVETGFRDFYGSVLFLVPAFLFFANLSVCSAYRFARELKKGRAGRHGPDILHLGLVLLLLGA